MDEIDDAEVEAAAKAMWSERIRLIGCDETAAILASGDDWRQYLPEARAGIRAAVLAEREACAKAAEASYPFDIETWMHSTKKEMTAHLGNAIAAAIRARGNGGENE